MNLKYLFELQAKLDERIEQEHPRQKGEDRLAKKILALQVELGELAQNWRGFKFWSHNQEPRIKDYKQIKCKWCNGSGDDGTGVCPDCRSSGDVYKEYNPLLEEYVDCLHFILSIGNETIKKYGKDLKELVLNDEILIHTNTKKEMDITSQFNILFLNTTSIYISTVDEYYDYEDSIDIFNELFESFIGLGEMLGFTWEQVEQAYLEKNEINHQRRESGY